MYKAFPHIFVLGKGLITHGPLSKKDSRHLLLQFHGEFAACIRIVFFLFDQLQGHSATRVIAAKVKTNPKSLLKFNEMVADSGFLQRLDAAKTNPESEYARSLLKCINKHVAVTNCKEPYTLALRKSSVTHLYNMARFYGIPSIFLTFAPDDIN